MIQVGSNFLDRTGTTKMHYTVLKRNSVCHLPKQKVYA